MKNILICFLALGVFIALPVSAQTPFTDTEISVDIYPSFPAPGQEVTATLNDYSGGAYGASIKWIFDGKESAESENKRKVTFEAGKDGEAQSIEAVLQTPDGSRIAIQKNIKPIYLDIIIEPQTRVPDFYLGRSLPSLGSVVNATALISDNDYKNSELIYTWKLGNFVLEGGRLRGGNQIKFTIPRGNKHTLSVSVSDLEGRTLAKRIISIPSVDPEIYFYEDDPLYGLSSMPIINTFSLIGQSAEIKAEPYYLATNVYNDPYYHQWTIDGVESSNSYNPYKTTLQKLETDGSSNLKFEVFDRVQVLQAAEGSIKINF